MPLYRPMSPSTYAIKIMQYFQFNDIILNFLTSAIISMKNADIKMCFLQKML